ncbi:Arc/MetJ family transcription regulator [Saccharopolyspora lacisalsi]|uniref:Arc/MetJ family transcription regulator n=1 Tax=Halosaccharopolyspora lacisalsi TaxID=1000566 RepID=A0A839DXP9_9PSEU|nr:hypothetical protein [Halosaccharopolyspora lacisalsi]MBA8825823.1 Arc/MetJ family transcription regulator [Halosaccharopolyspora lacisalsi]
MKHLVDVDEGALSSAREHLGTTTIKETVNTALRQASEQDAGGQDIETALDVLAAMDFEDREKAWH